MEHVWREIAERSGRGLNDNQIEALGKYRDWLRTEAGPAGGLGPGELDRLDERHIADSLLFLRVLPPGGPVLDVGSGVGLPGIPLAIARADDEFVLLERSGRRRDLLGRAIRVLGIENVAVSAGDFLSESRAFPRIVTRASLPPDEFRRKAEDVLEPGGIAVVAGSWVSPPRHEGYEIREIGSDVLAQPVWILIMQRT